MKPFRDVTIEEQESVRALGSTARSGRLRSAAWLSAGLLVAIAAGCNAGKIGTSGVGAGTGVTGTGAGAGAGAASGGGTGGNAASGGTNAAGSPTTSATTAAPPPGTGANTSTVCTGSEVGPLKPLPGSFPFMSVTPHSLQKEQINRAKLK